jgi:hypothetical protein
MMILTGYCEVAPEFSAPRVVIIDDQEKEVRILREYFEKEGFEVVHFTESEAFTSWLETHSLQILLIDVALGTGREQEGLGIVTKCREQLDSAIRLCISQRTLGSIGPQTIIDLMNPSAEARCGRVFHAFSDKARQAHVIELAEMLRAEQVYTDNCRIRIQADLSSHIDEELLRVTEQADTERIREGREVLALELNRELIEIIKRLLPRPTTPDGERSQEQGQPTIEVEKIGIGRSRTLVLRVTIQYTGRPRPLRYIVKVGAGLIEREVYNHHVYVSQFLAHAQYPALVKSVKLRWLSGLAYGALGELDRPELPPTLRQLLSLVAEADAVTGTRLVNHVFQSISTTELPRAPRRASSLRSRYEERFRSLKDTVRLQTLYSRAMKDLVEKGFCRERSGGFVLGSRSNHVLKQLGELLGGQVRFESYRESIVHGDLHLENVVYRSNEEDSIPYFLDFAHSGYHHMLLDHVVMEVSLRLQFACDRWAQPDGALPWGDVIALEVALLDRALGRSVAEQQSSVGRELFRLISAVRGSAAIRDHAEPGQRYFAALGLAAAGAMALPTKGTIQSQLTTWHSLVAGMSLTVFEDGTPVDLWAYREESTEDARLAAALSIVAPELVQRFERTLIGVSQQPVPPSDLDGLQKLGDELSTALGSSFSLAAKAIDEYVTPHIPSSFGADPSRRLFSQLYALIHGSQCLRIPEALRGAIGRLQRADYPPSLLSFLIRPKKEISEQTHAEKTT